MTGDMLAATGGAAFGIVLGRKIEQVAEKLDFDQQREVVVSVWNYLEKISKRVDRQSLHKSVCNTPNCGRYGANYMLRDEIWASASCWQIGDDPSAKPIDLLCLHCVRRRLGRPLLRDDFAEVPINEPIFAMYDGVADPPSIVEHTSTELH